MEPPPVLADDGQTAAIAPAEPVVPGAPPLATIWYLALLALAVAALWVFFGRGWHRFDRPPPPRRPRAFSITVGFGLFFGAIVLAQIGVLIGRAALGIDPQQSAVADLRGLALLGLSRYAAEALVIIIFAVLLYQARRPQPDRRLGVVASIAFGAGALLLFWTFVIVLTWIINIAMLLLRGWAPTPIAHETLATLILADRTVWFFIMAGIVLIVAPIFEEVIYRGLLQQALIRLEWPRWPAIAITSATFTLMHVGAAPSPQALPGMLAALFVLSLGFGWAYEKTGRLIAPITMHVLFNAGNLGAAMWLG